MDINDGFRGSLAAGGTLRVTAGRGLKITCLQGMLWITQDGDYRDIVLQPGQAFVLDRKGLALIHAFRTSAIAVSSSDVAASGVATPDIAAERIVPGHQNAAIMRVTNPL